ncbi:unnamed protein product [Scytosiphon promiscuus]
MDQEQRMSSGERLMWSVGSGLLQATDRALNDGADVNGSGTDLPPPIVLAANRGYVGIINMLIDRGADLEAALFETSVPVADCERFLPLYEARAVHAATEAGHLDALRVLLEAGADPNSLASGGATPLMLGAMENLPAATKSEMIDVLLSTGADPLLGNENDGGWKAIHYAALHGETLLVDKLLSSAPTTLNALDEDGGSPLMLASVNGHLDTVSFLLSVGASDAEAVETYGYSSLVSAVGQGKEDVVRILLDEGLEAVGGVITVPDSIFSAVKRDHACILQMLLNVEGEAMREAWAGTWAHPFELNGDVPAEPMLHIAARFCSYRAAAILLPAGADELAVNAQGRRPSDIIGFFVENSAEHSRHVSEKDAFRRMLKRGPAFRARSWVWPTPGEGVIGMAAERRRPLSSSVRAPALGVRLLRQKRRRLFPRALARYPAASDLAFLGGR